MSTLQIIGKSNNCTRRTYWTTMGRLPKALKSSTTSKEARAISDSLGKKDKSNKKIKFNDVSLNKIEEFASVVDHTQTVLTQDDAEGPEVISSNDASVQRIKELYNSLENNSYQSKRKRIKRQRDANATPTLAPFDVSLLDQSDENKIEEGKDSKESIIHSPILIDRSSNQEPKNRKLGTKDFMILNDNPDIFKEIKISRDTQTFLKIMEKGRKRISYTLFSSQKKPKPAKMFARKRSHS